LGILPGGTANVLAMELGLGSRVVRAAEKLTACVEQRIAVGRYSSAAGARHFIMMGGVGLDASIVANVNQEWKKKTGKLAYWAAGLAQSLRSVGQFEVRVNGETGQYGFALASRVRNYGGDLEIARGASLLCDEFELVTFSGSNPLRYAGYFLSLVPRQVQRMPGVRTVRTRRVEFRGSAHVQIDGEYLGETPACFEIVPDALTLLMPANYR
jgi:diacylglycerol kinase family enzyme